MPIRKSDIKKALADTADDYDDYGTEPEQASLPLTNPADNLLARVDMEQASEHQINIFHHIEEQIDNYEQGRPTQGALVEAVAGSGKTSSIVAASKLIPMEYKSIFLAFNKSIANELKKRLPKHIETATLNGIGLRQVVPYVKSLGCNYDPYKFTKGFRVRSIIQKLYGYKDDGTYSDVSDLVSKCKCLGIIPEGVDDGYAVDGKTATTDTLMELVQRFSIFIDPPLRTTVFARTKEVLKISWSESNIYETNCIDFDDQKYLAVCKRPNGSKMFHSKYDVIFVDEAQDLNPVDIELIRMLVKPNGVVIGVGDEHQCQPKGTVVSLIGGEEKDIADIEVGDRVVSFSTKKSYFGGATDKPSHNSGRAVEKTAKRHYSGNLYEVDAGGRFSNSTDNHRWLAKINDNARGKYCVYVMERMEADGRILARVGSGKLQSEAGFGLGVASRQHAADNSWILSVFNDEKSAKTAATIISDKYSIPERAFNVKDTMETDSWLMATDMLPKLISVLNTYRKSYEYPMWSKSEKNHTGKYAFVTQACNLLSDVMSVRTFDGTPRGGEWTPITVTAHPVEMLPVYSLQVEPLSDSESRRLYVADGIVTHNSIYGFRGSDYQALNKFVKYFNATRMPLSTTYRCSQHIVDYAQQLVPTIRAADNAPDGGVIHYQSYNHTTFEAGDMILCRNNGPLVDLAFKLVNNGIPVTITGRDFCKKLVNLINDCIAEKKWRAVANGKKQPYMCVEGKLVTDLVTALMTWKTQQLDIIRNNDPDNGEAQQSVLDRVGSVMTFVGSNTDGLVSSIVERIESIFQDAAPEDMVTLSTVHKAKGLEADRVFVYDPDLFTPWWVKPGTHQAKQERNLDYVSRTRAKIHYGILYRDGWKDD